MNKIVIVCQERDGYYESWCEGDPERTWSGGSPDEAIGYLLRSLWLEAALPIIVSNIVRLDRHGL